MMMKRFFNMLKDMLLDTPASFRVVGHIGSDGSYARTLRMRHTHATAYVDMYGGKIIYDPPINLTERKGR